MNIERYTKDRRQEWNSLVETSRNGTFLLLRGYMDYHSDRFTDHSLMYRNAKGKLLAVMPANEADGVLYSHQGLTYGGFILSKDVHAVDVRDMFDGTMEYLRQHGFTEWHYKPVPAIFHRYPTEEDEYWLWRMGAVQEVCNLSCAIDLTSDIVCTGSSRKNNSNRLARMGYTVDYDSNLADFWPILEENLRATYGAKPVHTLAEILSLKQSFPRNIICCTVSNDEGVIEAGTVLYIVGDVVHTQYISASAIGKQTKAIDYLMLSLIHRFKDDGRYRYFDFGTSNEDGGRILNESLIMQKEGFGGRGNVYRGYRIMVIS